MDVTHLKSNWDREDESEQSRGVEMPGFFKAASKGNTIIDLPEKDYSQFKGIDLVDAVLSRRSERKYLDKGLSLDELAWLLFATQGVQKELKRGSFRPSASAGARHPFESYIAVFKVDDLEPGLYHYLHYEHRLELVRRSEHLREDAESALNGQGWNAPAIFYWTAIPYRTHWRYPFRMQKLVALDAGHVGQNLYLACAAINCGTCAIAAYDQKLSDAFLGVDGTDELMVYAAPVGKISRAIPARATRVPTTARG